MTLFFVCYRFLIKNYKLIKSWKLAQLWGKYNQIETNEPMEKIFLFKKKKRIRENISV